MSKSIRIRTTPGGDDKYLKVKLEQDFDLLEILSLKLTQEEVYQNYCSNFGVVAGRISINDGFGLPNVKVSIFIPISDDDQQNEIISRIYPYKSTAERNSEGVQYNLLPKYKQHIDHTPVGTFPSKREVLDDETYIEVYEKYYKFTTKTNEAGDFLLYGVPVGDQVLHYDLDVSDIGFLSARPYELINQGFAREDFQDEFTFKQGNNISSLVQIKSEDIPVTVKPFWCDTLGAEEEIGVTRQDIPIGDYELIPTAIFTGSIYSDNENDSINKNCRPRRKTGDMNELITSEGKMEILRRNQNGDIKIFRDLGQDLIDENGNWSFLMPMNLRKLITAEDGTLIPSPDGKRGVASEADVRFRISMNATGDEKRLRTRAKMLVPNMEGNYTFGEYKAKTLRDAQDAGEPIYDINDETSLTPPAFADDPANEYNYLKEFFTFRWKKVYTVRQYVGRFQPNSNDENRNFIGIKDIARAEGINKMPFNRIDTNINGLYSIICIILQIFYFIVSIINGIINFINGIVTIICGIRIPCGICAIDCCDGVQLRRVCKDDVPPGGNCGSGNITAVGPWGPCVSSISACNITPAAAVTCPAGSCHNGQLGVGGGYQSQSCTLDCPGLTLFGKCWTLKYNCILAGICDSCGNCLPPGCPDCDDVSPFPCDPYLDPNESEGCCNGCCEIIPLIGFYCPNTGDENVDPYYVIPPAFGLEPCPGTLGDDICDTACNGDRINTISELIQCQLNDIASDLGLIKFDFYNDWVNGGLYFPLIKRKYKLKTSKKKFGQIKKDKFCDFDCWYGDGEYYLNDPTSDLEPAVGSPSASQLRRLDKDHGKPLYVEIENDDLGFSSFENIRGHAHHQNRCNSSYLVERKEFISDVGCDSNCPSGCGAGSIKACDLDDEGYNEDLVRNGIVKWEQGEIYYASIIPDAYRSISHNSEYIKRNMLYPTTITELGSSTFCDIDDHPFLMDKIDPTTYRVSERNEGGVNLNAYVDIGCLRVDCLHARNVAVSSQLGVEIFDFDDDDVPLGTCEARFDHDEDTREYFCRRFTTYKNTDMEINYKIPSLTINDNIYETYPAVTVTNLNDADEIIPGDRCRMVVNNPSSPYSYFYAMGNTANASTLLDYPNNTNTISGNNGTSFHTSHTPYYFFFGIVPGKTALHKTVSKFFADKIDKNTLKGVSEADKEESLITPPNVTEQSIVTILGSCLNK
jgi:hypothetical protein